MAKKAGPKTPSTTARAKERAKADDLSNSGRVNPEATKKALKRLQDGHRERLSIMGKAMNECAAEHKLDKSALDEAKKVGVPVRALKATFKLWVLDTKKEKIRSDLELDDRALLEQVEEACGFNKTPLGEAAAKDSAVAKGTKLLAALTGDEAKVASNVVAIETGIKQLN